MAKYVNLSGRRFGDLWVLGRAPRVRAHEPHAKWRCVCKCGEEIIVQGRHLKNGQKTSCGKCKNKTTKQLYFMNAKDMTKQSETLGLINRNVGDPYQNLASAIIAVAVDDYRDALKNDDKDLKYDLEQFFVSDWGEMLSEVDPMNLLKYLRKEHGRSSEAYFAQQN